MVERFQRLRANTFAGRNIGIVAGVAAATALSLSLSGPSKREKAVAYGPVKYLKVGVDCPSRSEAIDVTETGRHFLVRCAMKGLTEAPIGLKQLPGSGFSPNEYAKFALTGEIIVDAHKESDSSPDPSVSIKPGGLFDIDPNASFGGVSITDNSYNTALNIR